MSVEQKHMWLGEFVLLNTERCIVGKNWNHNNVTSPFSRLFYIHKGEATVTHHNKEFILCPGKLIFIPAFTTANYSCSSSLELTYFHFSEVEHKETDLISIFPFYYERMAGELDAALVKRLLQINPGKELNTYNPEQYRQEMYTYSTKNMVDIAVRLESTAILKQLLSHLMNIDKESSGIEDDGFALILSHIHKNLKDKLLVKDLSALACLSVDHFSKKFQQKMGLTPNLYIQKKRLEKAQYLLFYTSMSVKEIAFESGLGSLSYLHRLLVRHLGCTPSQYRKQKE